jgi:hypothetical protein
MFINPPCTLGSFPDRKMANDLNVLLIRAKTYFWNGLVNPAKQQYPYLSSKAAGKMI